MPKQDGERHGSGYGYLGVEMIMQAARDLGLFTRAGYIRDARIVKKTGGMIHRLGCTPQETLDFFQSDLRRLRTVIDVFQLDLDVKSVAEHFLRLGGINGSSNPRCSKTERR